MSKETIDIFTNREIIEILITYIDIIQSHDDEDRRETEILNLKYYYNGRKYYKEYFKIDYKLLLKIDTNEDIVFKRSIREAKRILLNNLNCFYTRTDQEEGVFYGLLHSIDYSIKYLLDHYKYKEIMKLYFNIFIDLNKMASQLEPIVINYEKAKHESRVISSERDKQELDNPNYVKAKQELDNAIKNIMKMDTLYH